jgi:hypothetical protein
MATTFTGTSLYPRRRIAVDRSEHFWRPNELSEIGWQQYTTTLRPLIAHMNARQPIICGRFGAGEPVLTEEEIIFNGNCDRYTWRTKQCHAHRATTIGETDDAHEDFVLPRVCNPDAPPDCLSWETIDTGGGKPYAPLVLFALVLMRRCWPEGTYIEATSTDAAEWLEACYAVRQATGAFSIPPELAAVRRLYEHTRG